jgi:hypothetical protein
MEKQGPGFHSHFEATFTYNPNRFEGSLKGAIDQFIPWWEGKDHKRRYAFTLDILSHVVCGNSLPADLGVEVKFHRTWTSSVSIKRVKDDLDKLIELRKAGVCRAVAFVNVYAPNNTGGQRGLDEVTRLLDEYEHREDAPHILRYPSLGA